MSKKARKKPKNLSSAGYRKGPALGRSKKRAAIVVLALCLCLVGAGVTGRGGFSRGVIGVRSWLAPAPVPTPDNFAPSNPAKEYIYAGGRLVATEEPSMVMPPAALVAMGASSAQVNVTWTASPGTIDHYQVERTPNISTSYTIVASSVTGLSFTTL